MLPVFMVSLIWWLRKGCNGVCTFSATSTSPTEPHMMGWPSFPIPQLWTRGMTIWTPRTCFRWRCRRIEPFIIYLFESVVKILRKWTRWQKRSCQNQLFRHGKRSCSWSWGPPQVSGNCAFPSSTHLRRSLSFLSLVSTAILSLYLVCWGFNLPNIRIIVRYWCVILSFMNFVRVLSINTSLKKLKLI